MDHARRVAQRLAGVTDMAPAGVGPVRPPARTLTPLPGYVRFSAQPVIARATNALGATEGNGEGALEVWDEFGVARWNQHLDRCLELTASDTAFVVDDNGLVVACRGRMTAEQVEPLGARLAVALEQLDQLDPTGARSGTLTVEFAGQYLTVLRPSGREGSTVLGVLGDAPIAPEARSLIDRVLGG